jgi:hypothetical protein
LQSGLWSTWFCSSCAVVTTSVSSRLLYDSDNDYWARKFTHSQEELDVASCKQLIPVKSPLSLAGLLGIVFPLQPQSRIATYHVVDRAGSVVGHLRMTLPEVRSMFRAWI